VKKHTAIELNIPKLPRTLMILLTAIHLFGVYAYFVLIVVRGNTSFSFWVRCAFCADLVCCMSIPESIGSQLVTLFGESFLRRLMAEADFAWRSLTRER
jgi:hypothetical protein